MLSGYGIDATEAHEAVKNILSENVIPTHIALQVLVEIWSKRSDVKSIPSVKPFNAFSAVGDNTEISYQVFTSRSDLKSTPSVKSYSQFII